ncbi:MAG TPA: hypothetical protein VFN43_07985, partial [Humibacillus sp.]|nr:hypothetical protein [Humibacillus sp.]
MTFQTRTTIPEEAAREGLLAVVIERAVRGARVAASAWLIGRGASTIDLMLPTPRVVVGEQAIARLVAVNPGRRRYGGVQLE